MIRKKKTIISHLCVSFWNFVRDARRFQIYQVQFSCIFIWILRTCTFIFVIKTLRILKCSKCPTNVHSPSDGFALDSKTKETQKTKQSYRSRAKFWTQWVFTRVQVQGITKQNGANVTTLSCQVLVDSIRINKILLLLVWGTNLQTRV